MALTWLFNSVPTAARAEEEAPAAPMELLAANEISKYIDYSSAVEHGHVARVCAEEDMNTLVYLNQDGTKTAYFFDHDVKYEDADGNIKEKDIGLKTVDGGLGLKQSDITLKLPTDVLDGVEFTHNGNYIKLVPLVDNMQTSIGQLVTQPMDAVINTADNKVTYGRAFGAGVSLKYTPVINGVKEDIILNSYTGENIWSFLLTTNGMYPFTDEGGVYYFAKTANAANKYSLGRVYAYDSNGSEAYGTMDVTEVKPGAMYIVSLSVDDTFLQGAEYPVTVDPTLTVPSAGITDVGLYQGAAATNKDSETDNYIGSSTRLGMGRAVFRANSLINSPILYTYMSSVVSAEFKLYINYARLTNQSLSIHQCTDYSWTETGATWNNCAADFESSAYDTVAVTGTGYVSFDITSAISRWRNNSNMLNGGLLVKNASESSGSNHLSYYSTENSSSNKPMIIVKYKTDMADHFKTDVIMSIGDKVSLVKSSVFSDSTITYRSLNTTRASVSASGEVTAKSAGSVSIEIVIDPNGARQVGYCTVEVGSYPDVFVQLNNMGYLHSQDIAKTDDGFYMMLIPISDIMEEAGISVLYTDSNYVESNRVDLYYDDWYIYCVNDGIGESYSVLKLREMEVDGKDGDDPGVSIPFVSFNVTLFIECINAPNNRTKNHDLYLELKKVTECKCESILNFLHYDWKIACYFSITSSEAPYVIAYAFVDKLINEHYINGRIELTESVTGEVKGEPSIVENLTELNKNGVVYDMSNSTRHSIKIANPNSLTNKEMKAIMLGICFRDTLYHFAGEIQLHALATLHLSPTSGNLISTIDTITGLNYYEKAVKADLGAGESADRLDFIEALIGITYDVAALNQMEAHGQ